MQVRDVPPMVEVWILNFVLEPHISCFERKYKMFETVLI